MSIISYPKEDSKPYFRSCAEESMYLVRDRWFKFRSVSTSKDIAFAENATKALNILSEYGIESARLVKKNPTGFHLRFDKELTLIEVEGLAAFRPLVHALIRATRDSRTEERWIVLDAVAYLTSILEITDDEFFYSGTGSVQWLKEEVNPKLWAAHTIEKFPNVKFADQTLMTFVAWASGLLEQEEGVKVIVPKRYKTAVDRLYQVYEINYPTTRRRVNGQKAYYLPEEFWDGLEYTFDIEE